MLASRNWWVYQDPSPLPPRMMIQGRAIRKIGKRTIHISQKIQTQHIVSDGTRHDQNSNGGPVGIRRGSATLDELSLAPALQRSSAACPTLQALGRPSTIQTRTLELEPHKSCQRKSKLVDRLVRSRIPWADDVVGRKEGTRRWDRCRKNTRAWRSVDARHRTQRTRKCQVTSQLL